MKKLIEWLKKHLWFTRGGAGVKVAKKFIIIFVLFLAGCSYHKVTTIQVNGKNVRYGLTSGDDLNLTINRYVKFGK